MNDVRNRGRQKGECNPRVRLAARQVEQIMAALKAGAKRQALARTYGVHYQTITDIQLGRRWAHLTGTGA